MKKPIVKLTGTDGNVFALLGTYTKALKRADQPAQARELAAKVLAAKSYGEALQLMMQYVDVR